MKEPPTLVFRSRRSQNHLYSFFDIEDRRISNNLIFSEPKIGSKITIGLVMFLRRNKTKLYNLDAPLYFHLALASAFSIAQIRAIIRNKFYLIVLYIHVMITGCVFA